MIYYAYEKDGVLQKIIQNVQIQTVYCARNQESLLAVAGG